MTLNLKDYLFFGVLVALLVMVVLWGIQKRRADLLETQKDVARGFQTQERVEKEYIPAELKKKDSNELSRIGGNLWRE
jgi:hypothetical protein